MIKRINILAGFLTLLVFFSCDSESTNDSQLMGKYNIVKAERNGKETKTLKDGIFDFAPEGLLKTNIFGQDFDLIYIIEKGGRIKISGAQEFILIPMPSLNDTLVYRTKIRKMRMKFYIVKQKAVVGAIQ